MLKKSGLIRHLFCWINKKVEVIQEKRSQVITATNQNLQNSAMRRTRVKVMLTNFEHMNLCISTAAVKAEIGQLT